MYHVGEAVGGEFDFGQDIVASTHFSHGKHLINRRLFSVEKLAQDDSQWMEKVFENALKDPTIDWNEGSANIWLSVVKQIGHPAM